MSSEDRALTTTPSEIDPLFRRSIMSIRPELQDSPYIAEALRVLPAKGYRSAIGCVWNAVVDDLRNKIIHRSLSLFNKSMPGLGREIKTYEDFQNHVNDDELIEGAYKTGVIGWEASKLLKQAKETRHIFDGHPKSSEPSLIKVLAMLDDCTKYVLCEEYPPQIIDIDDYLMTLASDKFDRNKIAIENAIDQLPDIYKKELIHRLFNTYIEPTASSVLRSNIEVVAPILWRPLPQAVKAELSRRVDQEITKGNVEITNQAFAFVHVVDAARHLTLSARRYKVQPLVERLKRNWSQFTIADEVVAELEPYAAYIPPEAVDAYVLALTGTYVGEIGASVRFARTDFYADHAATIIPAMFEAFDDRAVQAFIDAIRGSTMLRNTIQHPTKMNRLRTLGVIALSRASEHFAGRELLEALTDDTRETDFYRLLDAKIRPATGAKSPTGKPGAPKPA
jgi:hypothetical protein